MCPIHIKLPLYHQDWPGTGRSSENRQAKHALYVGRVPMTPEHPCRKVRHADLVEQRCRTLKWLSRCSYSNDADGLSQTAASHMSNLCWTLSSHTICMDLAAPDQTMMPNSKMECTCALKAMMKGDGLNLLLTDMRDVWSDRR